MLTTPAHARRFSVFDVDRGQEPDVRNATIYRPLPIDMAAEGLGTAGGTPSLFNRPTLAGVRHASHLSPDAAESPSPDGGSPSTSSPGPAVFGFGGRAFADNGSPDTLRSEDALGGEQRAAAGRGTAGGRAKRLGHERSDATRDGDRSASPASLADEGGGSMDGGRANAGCMPGSVSGKGEGLSALFIHPDEDVYDLTDGGGILAEPPRGFEALAFAPREPHGHSRKPISPSASASAAPTAAESARSEPDLVSTFASAAALGAHRTPPRVIRRCPGQGDSQGFSWQMWASDSLTDAIGVPPVDDEAEAAAEDPAADDPRGGARGKGRGRGGSKGTVVEATNPSSPDGRQVDGIKTAGEVQEEYRKMHIDYKGIMDYEGTKRDAADATVAAAEATGAAGASKATAASAEDAAAASIKKRAAAASINKRGEPKRGEPGKRSKSKTPSRRQK